MSIRGLGIANFKLKNYAEAKNNFCLWIELNPTAHEAYLHLALTFQKLIQVNAAEQSFRKAIEINSNYRSIQQFGITPSFIK